MSDNGSEIIEAIEEWQSGTPTPESAAAKVFIAPEGEPGFVEIDVEADEDVHPAKFHLQLADHIETTLEDESEYNGQVTKTGKGTIYLEDVARDMWSDFDGLDE